jgi:tetratricopeptide (TPR) repeat protein
MGVPPMPLTAWAWARRPCYVLSVLLLFGLTGCANKAHEQAQKAVEFYYAGDYDQSLNLLRPLAQKTNEDFVLNNCRLGSVALTSYHLDEAEAAFLRAYEVINSVGVNNGGRSIGAVLVDEKIKIWKGEPFERAMANFYLGVIYYMRQDYGNARAAFENALFKLRDVADETGDKADTTEQDSNFILASVMLAKCWQRLGRDDLAHANFDYVTKLRPELADLASYDRNAESNLLLIVDFGYGPKKVTDFDGAIVGFGPKPMDAGAIPRPRVIVDGEPYQNRPFNRPTIDLLAMAQDRKWQSIDTIRTIKSAVGTGLLYAGAFEGVRGVNGTGAAQRRDLTAAAALLGAGLLLKATSQADIRQWELLPRTTFVLPMKVPPGAHELKVDFPEIGVLRQTWRGLIVPESGEATYYMRMQRTHEGPFDWPPPALVQAQPQPPQQNPQQAAATQPASEPTPSGEAPPQ